MKQIPAMVLSGFAGAGKTTLLRRLLAAREGSQVAVIVSALGHGEVDAGLCESNTTDGSIRCVSREHLGMELRKVGRARSWDHLLVESTAASEPLPVAEVFAVDDGRGTAISRYLTLDALVTVVDATRFFEDYASPDKLAERQLATSAADDRSVVEVLAAQVEVADILVVTKVDLVDEARLSRLEALLARLNPRARVLRSALAEVPLSQILDTGLFNFAAAVETLGTTRHFERPAEPAAHGFASFGYRRFRPFHPQRFEALARGDWSGVVRSKGTFWLASRSDSAGEWSQAGKAFHHAMAGSFWAATPEGDWPVSDERKARIKTVWQEPFGDRRQELAFVVENLEREALEKRLDACLLTDDEMALGPEGWKKLAGHAPHEPAHHDHPHHDHPHEPAAREPFKGHSPAGGHHSN
jgi:G3E family GTPase